MAESASILLALPDDVVGVVFAKLDFADITLYAYLSPFYFNFTTLIATLSRIIQVCDDIEAISQSCCDPIRYKH
jgi:hypothetical protein